MEFKEKIKIIIITMIVTILGVISYSKFSKKEATVDNINLPQSEENVSNNNLSGTEESTEEETKPVDNSSQNIIDTYSNEELKS